MGMATIALAHPAPAAEGPALPQNVEAEAALLGAMMIDNRVADDVLDRIEEEHRSEEHTSELQSLMRISYAVFCLKKKKKYTLLTTTTTNDTEIHTENIMHNKIN